LTKVTAGLVEFILLKSQLTKPIPRPDRKTWSHHPKHARAHK